MKILFLKNMVRTKSHREGISLGLKGVKFDEERLKHMSEGRKGKSTGDAHWNWNPDRNEILARRNVRKIIGSLLRRIFYRLNKKKSEFEKNLLLDYSANDLRLHIESLFADGMTWENCGWGDGKWCIDHIRPVISWPLDTDPKIINSLSNLKPMWFIENCKKGAKYNE